MSNKEVMNESKEKIVSLLLFVVDFWWMVAGVFICWGLYRFIDYGNSDLWGSAFIAIGIFAPLFALAWKRDKGYYNW